MIAASHGDSSSSGLSDAARMRWRISREELSSTETATSNDGTSLTWSAWLNLSPPSPFPVYWEPSKRHKLIGWHSPSPLPPLAHPLHVIIFLFNNQPWKRVGRKTSKYSHSHDSTRHECTAKLSQTSLRGGAQTDEGFNSWPLESAEWNPLEQS